MHPFPDRESVARQHSVDPTVMVSMCQDHLVICAPAQLDLEMTEVLVIAAASALTSGTNVMIDLDPDTASPELLARRPLSVMAGSCVLRDGGPVAVLGAGYVRLATRDAYWTIDLAHGRLCRSDARIDPYFVRPDEWTRIHALWVTQTSITALTSDGTYLSGLAEWTTRPRSELPAPV